MLNRRQWMLSTAALAGAQSQGQSSPPKNIVVSSSNGLRACAKAMEMLKAGADTLDAVIAGVNINELDPEDNSVGYGGLPNEEGIVELDASVMHGPTRRCGSVASIRNVKTPSNVAKLVMEQSDHVMIVGEGAWRFAKAWGFKEEDLLTEKSRLAWMVWKQSLRDAGGHNNWTDGLDAPPKKGAVKKTPVSMLKEQFPHATEELLAWAWGQAVHPTTGTINCLALNPKGEMSGVTTTSGLAWKIPGRIGDSPIIGAGLYVDQEVGGAGSTGRGEENIRVAGAHTIVENMRHGMTPQEACLDALKRVARNYDNDRDRLAKFDINFYALRKDGAYGSATLWKGKARGAVFSVNDGGESRHELCATLLER
ncbi:MAG: N(4)-(beta-N-acetylglucosaminyl)-L-asparaginase [Fimbriimonas ginsengisoli]|nr:N(4)-(beta-N-acetylglucosaminyl)-L-asparaginase [Fimbriimonas ginsengisoli]